MAKQYYPVTRTGRLAAGTNGEFEINIDRFLSKTNRRLYRHARTYRVKIDLDADSTEKFDVYALASNWMNYRGLKMAYEMYMLNSEDERERLKGTQVARWQDFRTISGGSGPLANPVQYNATQIGTALASGEFALTLVVDSSGNSKEFTWGSASISKYSILAEYDKAGNAQSSPNTSTGDMPYDTLMADDDAVMANSLQVLGENPPYDKDSVLDGTQWVKVATIDAASQSQRLSSGFFDAPCGFVIIQQQTGTADKSADLSWTVQSGDYKGVHAPSMLE